MVKHLLCEFVTEDHTAELVAPVNKPISSFEIQCIVKRHSKLICWGATGLPFNNTLLLLRLLDGWSSSTPALEIIHQGCPGRPCGGKGHDEHMGGHTNPFLPAQRTQSTCRPLDHLRYIYSRSISYVYRVNFQPSHYLIYTHTSIYILSRSFHEEEEEELSRPHPYDKASRPGSTAAPAAIITQPGRAPTSHGDGHV